MFRFLVKGVWCIYVYDIALSRIYLRFIPDALNNRRLPCCSRRVRCRLSLTTRFSACQADASDGRRRLDGYGASCLLP